MYEPLIQALESGATIVTANNRLARSLVHAYGQARQANGEQAWTSPDVLSWQAWLNRLWEYSGLHGGRGAECTLISDTDAAILWEQTILQQQSEVAAATAPRLAARSWQQLCDWEAIDAPEWTSAGLTADQQLFIRWTGQYRDQLKQQGWIDTGLLSAELIHDIDAGLFDGLGQHVFAGFDVWVPADQSLRNALNARSVVTEIAPLTVFEQASPERIECQTDRSELEQAARWARLEAETDSSLVICVVVPDLDARPAEARRVFMDVFCPDWRTRDEYALPVNFSYGTALAERPRVAAALNLLWLAQGDTDYRRFSLALGTPFLTGGREEADGRAQLDLKLRAKLGVAFTLKDAHAFARKYAPEFAGLLVSLLANLSEYKVQDKRTLSAWADWITLVLKESGWPGADTLDSAAWQELEAWTQLLRDFAASSKLSAPVSLTYALGLLERLAAARLHQPEAGAGVVQVMGIMEAAGHQFDRLWVTGMAAEDWPPARSLNPLLPFDLQRRCGMRGSSPALELEYAARLTDRLRQSSPATVFSWAGNRDGEALHPSGLISDLPVQAELALWSAASWPALMFAQADICTLENDRPAPWVAGTRVKGGSALFQLQASCPLRAFLQCRLGVEEVSPPVTGIGFMERGSLAHKVLEKFYKKFPNSKQLKQLSDMEAADELNELTSEYVNKLPGLSRPFMRTIADLETQRLMPLLMDFVMLDKTREDFTIVRSEEDQPDVIVGPLKLWLKLDRLDELSNGDRVVIDYKTGLVKRSDWNPARPGNMQLPLYATYTGDDIKGVAFAQLSAHEVKYEGIAEGSVQIEGVVDPADMRSKLKDVEGNKLESWDELVEAWSSCLLTLAEDFAAGNCIINPRQSALAEGQMAVLTRVYDLPDIDTGEVDGDG
jgi:ATP-dependent helicase/nuclease subunit B